MTARLQAVAEETLVVLSEAHEDEAGGGKRLIVSASGQGPTAELEFVRASGAAENLEDRIALLANPGPRRRRSRSWATRERAVGRDASLRLLRHYAASVTHRQYHDIEVVSVRVASPSRD